MDAAIYALLTQNSPGAPTYGTRVYPDELPQDPTFPAIVYTEIFTGSDYTHDGPDGVRRSRFQVDCMALTPDEAIAIRREALARLSGFKGEVGSPPIVVQGIFHDGGNADTASEMLNAGPRVRLKRFEVQCFFRG